MSTTPKTAFDAWNPDAILTLSFYIAYGISYALTLFWFPGAAAAMWVKIVPYLYFTYVSIM